MKTDILILTNSEDGEHTSVVENKLRARGGRIFRLDVDKLVSGQSSVVMRAGSSDWGFALANTSGKVLSDGIKSVWYRRPNVFNFAISDPIQKRYSERELEMFLEGLWLGLSDAFWLNSPWKLESARKKIYQLKVAQTLGFVIPRTIVTNNPEEVEKFFGECRGQVVFKAIYAEFLRYGDKQFNIPTTRVTNQHLERLKLVQTLPSLFQQLIPKVFEWRVTVVGDQIFPIRINSQEYEETMVDWRRPDFVTKLNYQVDSLPDELTRRCMAMMDIMGLSYGAFDFVTDEKGETYFLELNSNPQWYWLEDLTGVLISDAIADILALAPEERRTEP